MAAEKKKTIRKTRKSTPVAESAKNPVEERINALADEIIARVKTPEEEKPPLIPPGPPDTPAEKPAEATAATIITETVDTTITEIQTEEPAKTPPPAAQSETKETAPAEEKPEEEIITAAPAPAFAAESLEKETVPLLRSYRFFIIAVSTLITAGLILLIFNFFKKGTGSAPAPAIPTSFPVAETSPTPAFDKSAFTLEIFNGSGVPGAAKKYAAKLANLGYTIIRTGNADKSDYKTNELKFNEKFRANVDGFVSDIKPDMKIGSVSGGLKNSTAAARLIIGKE